MSSDLYEVILDGGGPWGIRLQGGKDFGIPLNIARVTPGSKAANKRLIDGDQIMEINYTPTETLTHMEAQNIIKNAGDKLQLKLKPGKGVSLGEIKQVGSGAFAANPSQTLYVTETVHSADVDHKYNAKPRAFGTTEPTASAAVSGKKFDPAEYARKKKEELEKYKEEKNNPKEIDSDVLKMLQNTHVNQGQGSFARLENQLQHEDLPPPPPDMFDHEHEAPKSGGTFKSMQHHIEAGTADEIKTVFSQPPGQRGQPIYAGPPKKITSPQGYVNPAPKSSMASGPNFKVGKAAAPTFKANPVQTYLSKPPPPPAVNAQEIQNPNSRLLSNSQYPSPQQTYESNKPSSPTNSYQQPVGGPGRFSPQSYGNPPPQPAGNINKIMTKGSPQSTTVTPQKGLVCHACEQPLIGPFVSAIGRTWHPEHFCCSACNTSLQNQAFVEENNSLYCEKCYNQYFAPKCAHCNNAIIGTATNDIICDMCLASADRVFDPLQCSLSINWLMKQLNEVNSSTDAAARQISENNARIKKARIAISKANADRKSHEEKISLCEKEIVKVSQALELKQKMLAAGANLRSANEKFAANMQILQSDLDTAKCKLYSWQSTLAEITTGYKLKCERLEVAQQRRCNLHIKMNELQTTLDEMNRRIKEIKRKQESRTQAGVTMLEEVKLLEFAVEEVETRKVFAEQHLESLRLYEEMLKSEHLQQRVANLNLQDEVEIAQRKKKDLMRQLNISHPMQVLR
ncbi:uncharacterized protein LOC100200433 isoform X4 [Hydra vulgaris]|uniref:Uncharacterized protein LOC100200433 isoform X4 n=1 Tax=Hydra vulgaris TaxID=6087 RepID=A0ABM4BYJ5_HYDVU